MNKRIVIVRSNAIEPDSRVEKEANSLVKNGNTVTLVAWDRSDNYLVKKDFKKLVAGKVRRISFGAKASFGVGMKSLLPYLKFQISLFLWLLKNKNNYDICHFCDFDTAFTGSNACMLTKKPFIFDIFDYLSTDANTGFQRLIEKLENNIINHSSATIICTEQRKMQIRKASPKKVEIIHNTPDIFMDNTNDDICHDDEKIKIAYVGIFQEYRLLEELLSVVSKSDNIELHIGGFGKLENIVNEYSIKYSNIFYYGKLQYREALNLEKKCDIMTAIYDPQIGNHLYAAPNKFYEALLLGKPLIMVKNTGMSENIKKHDIGVLIDYSEKGLKEGIETLIKNRDKWIDMSRKMKKLYTDEFSWNEMERRLIKLYDSIDL